MSGSTLSKRKIPNFSLCIGILVAIFLQSPKIMAQAQNFKILEKKGVIWHMTPLESSWQNLRQDVLPEGSLLRLEKGAMIKLQSVSKYAGKSSVGSNLVIKEPLIVRLDTHLFKKIFYRDYLLDALWSEGAAQEKEAPVHPMLSFSAAFIRHVVGVNTSQTIPPSQSEEPSTDSVEVGQKTDNLRILSPGQKSLHFIEGSAAKIPVYWESRDDSLVYRIYLWSARGVKRSPQAEVKGRYYILEVPESGEWRLQIMSKDLRFVSQVLHFMVEGAGGAQRVASAKDLRPEPPKSNDLTMTYPPSDFVMTTRTTQAQCLFTWNDQQILGLGEEYVLTLVDQNTKTIKEYPTRENFYKMRILPGKYSYFLAKRSLHLTANSIVTPTFELNVMTSSREAGWKNLSPYFNKMMKDQTVLLDL